MNKEIEATFLDIDKNEYRAKLKKAGAKLIHPEVLMRRTVFDTGSGSFLRVRDEGQKIVMTYKNIEKLSLEGVNEVNVEVNSYEDTVILLTAAGLKVKALQATLREKWVLDDVEVTIDTWPALPPYTEIEGPSAKKVNDVAGKLGFSMDDALYGSVDEIYHYYYGVGQNDVNYCPEIVIGKTPVFLDGLDLVA